MDCRQLRNIQVIERINILKYYNMQQYDSVPDERNIYAMYNCFGVKKTIVGVPFGYLRQQPGECHIDNFFKNHGSVRI